MNVFKKFLDCFLKPKECSVLEKEGADIVFYISGRILTPLDVLEPLASTVSIAEDKTVEMSMDNIEVFNLYRKKDKYFIGTCYVVKRNDSYYGGLVGEDAIFVCSKDDFVFEKTDIVSVPLKKTKDEKFTLLCSLNIKNTRMHPLYIEKTFISKPDKKIEVAGFTENYPLDQAIDYCRFAGFL